MCQPKHRAPRRILTHNNSLVKKESKMRKHSLSWLGTTVALAALLGGAWSCGSHSTTSASASAKSSFTLPVSNATGAPQSFADVVDRVTPAVVTIRSSRRIHAPVQFPFLDDPFFRQLF